MRPPQPSVLVVQCALRHLMQGMARRLWLLVLLAGASAALAQPPAGAADTPAWRIVLVMGIDPSLPAMRLFDDAFRQTVLAGSPGGATFFTEAIDAMRFAGAAIEPQFLALQRQKYASQRVDLVVGVGDGSVDFMREHARALWPGVPMLMAALDADRSTADRLPAGMPAQMWRLDVDATLTLIERLQPTAQRLVLVAGATAYDRGTLQTVQRAVAARARWQVDTWEGDSVDGLRQRVAGLDAGTAVLFTSMLRDGQGRASFSVDAMGRVAETSKAPVYGLYGTFIGRGSVAGQVVDFAAAGSQAAGLAQGLVQGRADLSGSPVHWISTRCAADFRQLQAHGLSVVALPAGCDLLHPPRNLWTEYRGFVLTAAAVVLLQTATIALLLWQRRQRRRAEAEALQRRTELGRAMRFAAIGELTASIAHEINQPLGAILSNADAADLLLKGGQAKPGELREILADIRRDDMRAHEVIRRLRALLEKHEPEHGPMAMHAVLDDVLALVVPEAQRRGVTVERQFRAADDRMQGDAVQLQQVLLNLAINAMDAMAGTDAPDRRLRIETTDRGNTLVLTVADRGSGIGEADRGRVFESFFTTKQHGLGLGLPIVRAIVEAHHGHVDAAPRAGGGTVFTVTLPRGLEPQAAGAGAVPGGPGLNMAASDLVRGGRQ